MIFGHCQNHQNKTFIRPYQPKKSGLKNCFYAKINTTLMLYLHQSFIFLLGHLHFFLHFFFAFMENLLKKHLILLIWNHNWHHFSCITICSKLTKDVRVLSLGIKDDSWQTSAYSFYAMKQQPKTRFK